MCSEAYLNEFWLARSFPTGHNRKCLPFWTVANSLQQKFLSNLSIFAIWIFPAFSLPPLFIAPVPLQQTLGGPPRWVCCCCCYSTFVTVLRRCPSDHSVDWVGLDYFGRDFTQARFYLAASFLVLVKPSIYRQMRISYCSDTVCFLSRSRLDNPHFFDY